MIFVYILEDKEGKFYVGVSKNPDKRLLAHNSRRGAKFTDGLNWKIVFLEKYETLIEARKREIQLKNWRRGKKEVLIDRYTRGLETRLGVS